MIDDPITYVYPLVVIIEDCFVPESVRHLLPVVADLDDESARVTVKLQAMDAEVQLQTERN